jgi:hypothetical protein
MTRQSENLQISDDREALFIASLGAIARVFYTKLVSSLFRSSVIIIALVLILVVIIPPHFP